MVFFVDFLDLNDFPAPVPAGMCAPEALVESFEEVYLFDELPGALLLFLGERVLFVEFELQDVVLDVWMREGVPRAMFSWGVRYWGVFL